MRASGIGPAGTLVAKGILDERERLVLADFESATDSVLATTVTETVRRAFAESSTLRFVERDQLAETLRRMGRDPRTSAIDAETAREIAIREGLKGFVGGVVDRVGTGYVLSADLVLAASPAARFDRAARSAVSPPRGFIRPWGGSRPRQESPRGVGDGGGHGGRRSSGCRTPHRQGASCPRGRPRGRGRRWIARGRRDARGVPHLSASRDRPRVRRGGAGRLDDRRLRALPGHPVVQPAGSGRRQGPDPRAPRAAVRRAGGTPRTRRSTTPCSSSCGRRPTTSSSLASGPPGSGSRRSWTKGDRPPGGPTCRAPPRRPAAPRPEPDRTAAPTPPRSVRAPPRSRST